MQSRRISLRIFRPARVQKACFERSLIEGMKYSEKGERRGQTISKCLKIQSKVLEKNAALQTDEMKRLPSE